MTVYGSRDRNPFQVPKEYEINGVKTPSNNGDKKYYTLVDSSTGQITVKSPTPAGALFGSDSDNTIGTISKDGTFKPSLGVANVNETKYFSSAVGQKDVKNHGVITAQKAGAQNAQQLIFPNSATPGAGQGQNAPIPGVAGSTSGESGGVSDAEFKAGISGSANTRNQFPTLKYPETLDAGKQDVIKFSMEGAIKIDPDDFDMTTIPPECILTDMNNDAGEDTSNVHPYLRLKAKTRNEEYSGKVHHSLLSFSKRDSPIHCEIIDIRKPSKTIICTYDHQPRLFVPLKNKNGYYLRCILPDELKQIQGFPSDFILTGPNKEKIKQIGNAVPPPLIRQIVEKILIT